MPHRALLRPAPDVVACLAVCLVVLSGCTGDSTSEPQPASPSASASPSPSDATPTPATSPPSGATDGPSASPSASPTASPSASVGPGGGTLRSRLLTAAELPGFNPDYRWTQGATRPESPSSSFGTCQRFSITAIGAERAVVRRFAPARSGAARDRAGELVATFPDDLTARRAFAVLQAWRAKCADRLKKHRSSDVGPLESVSVNGGRAQWYLLTYGPVPGDRHAQFFDAQGMAVVGSRITMVSMVLAGQDYTYEPGQEPMVAALQRAALKLA